MHSSSAPSPNAADGGDGSGDDGGGVGGDDGGLYPRHSWVDAGSQLVAGFSVVRTLSESADSRVLLGFAAPTPHGGPQLAALKLYRGASGRNTATAEVAALTRAQRPHVVALLDCATTPDGLVCLVLERLQRGSLAQFLARRGSISPGELVTILAPLAQALDGMHESGVAHGGVRASAVLFNDTGAPVLSSFAHAGVFEPGLSAAALSAHPLVRADRLSLAALVTHVLSHAPLTESSGLVTWLGDCERLGFPDSFGQALADRLYQVAEPAPLTFMQHSSSRAGRVAHSHRGRAVAVGSPLLSGTVSQSGNDVVKATAVGPLASAAMWVHAALPARFSVRVATLFAKLGVEEWLTARDNSPLVRGLTQVRKPVWLAVGAVAIALALAVALVPADSVESSAEVAEGANTADPVPDPDDAERSAVADDPVVAAAALVEARQRCVRDLSILCLDSVAQQGSVAMEADVALIRELQAGDAESISSAPGAIGLRPDALPLEFVLVERLGATALIDVHTPNGDATASTTTASLLLMKGEAGWRIRSYVTVNAAEL